VYVTVDLPHHPALRVSSYPRYKAKPQRLRDPGWGFVLPHHGNVYGR
jgi:hypothetical protein